jgi:hypothetical protein
MMSGPGLPLGLSVLLRRQVTQRAVRTDLVVVEGPLLDRLARFIEAGKTDAR